MSNWHGDDDDDYTYTIIDGSAFIVKYKGYGGHVIVPDTLGGCPVTIIGHSAFAHHADISGVNLPSSLLNLGDMAFHNCHAITRVVIQNGVVSIGNSVFAGCSLLEQIVLPASVTSIGNYVLPFREPPEKELAIAHQRLAHLRRDLEKLIDWMDEDIQLRGGNGTGIER